MVSEKTIGLIGVGIWGSLILAELQKQKVPVLIFDSDETKRSNKNTNLCRTADTLTAFKHVDGIIVATPSTTHADLIDRLAEFALPMFIEKPLTTSVQDARRLSKYKHLPIFVMHIWKYHPGIQTLSKVAQSGILGEILFAHSIRANWTSPRTDTDSIWNLAPHDLTIAEAILGYIPQPKCAIAEVHHGIARGLTAILGGSPSYCFEVSNRYIDKRREVRVHGLNGIAILEKEDADSVHVYLGADTSQLADVELREYPINPSSALTEELRCFIEFLDGGTPPPTDLNEGIRIIETIQAIRQLAGL